MEEEIIKPRRKPLINYHLNPEPLIAKKTPNKWIEKKKIANPDENPNPIKSPIRLETLYLFKPNNRTLKTDEINMHSLQKERNWTKSSDLPSTKTLSYRLLYPLSYCVSCFFYSVARKNEWFFSPLRNTTLFPSQSCSASTSRIWSLVPLIKDSFLTCRFFLILL